MDQKPALPGGNATLSDVHHIGMSVSSLEAALGFWEPFLGVAARWRSRLDRPYLSRVVGYRDVAIEAAFIDLPGGNVLELLDYQVAGKTLNDDATANPGNVHVCLAVDDAGKAWQHACDCGARPVDPAGPVDIDGGPNKGARAAYLRIHDGITLELFQRAKAADQSTWSSSGEDPRIQGRGSAERSGPSGQARG